MRPGPDPKGLFRVRLRIRTPPKKLYKCVCVGVRGLVRGCGWVGVYAGVDIYTCVCMYLRLCVRLCVLNMCTHV